MYDAAIAEAAGGEAVAHDGVVAMGVDADIVDDGEAIAEDVLHHAVAGGQGGDAVDDGIGARLVEPSALLDPPVGDVRPRDEGEGGDAFPALHGTHYLHEMEPLLHIRHEKPIDGGTIKVGFSTYGNKHLFSDTFGRSRVLLKEDLKDLGTLLENSTYIDDSALTHSRRDDIVHFYYYKAELHGRTVRLNVAKEVEELNNGRILVKYYLYSINDINE